MGYTDDIVSQWMKRTEAEGGLKSHPGFGKPMDFDDGFLETPEDLRLGYKILKNAGYVPAEVEMMQQVASLRLQADQAPNADERARVLEQVNFLQLKIALALEALHDKS